MEKNTNTKIKKTIKAEAQGNVELNRINSNLGLKHSQFTPTGIFVTKASKISICCSDKNTNLYAFIGQWGPYKNLNDGKALNPEQVEIKTTAKIFNPAIDGVLYISNQELSKEIEVTIEVTNGLEIPTFKLNETKSEEFNQQIKATTSPFVELIGKHVFGTFQIELANELWKDNLPAIEKLNEIINDWDDVYQLSNYVSGLSLEFDGIAKKHHNLIHMANPDTGPGSMYAAQYYVGFQQSTRAGKNLFTQAKSTQWAVWHEIGHTYQNQDYKFDGFAEVSVNINSFWVQEEFGFRNRLFSDKKAIEAIKNHINSDNPNKFITDLDLWGRLGMYLQLHMAYGKEFYPTLNQEYRLLTWSEKPANNDDKYQLFIKMTSKVANRNLIPFFEKWGIHPTSDTEDFVKNYPLLEKDIWNNIFDDHMEANAIIDYQLKKYQPLSGVKVKDQLLILNAGDEISQSELEEYLTDLAKDMKIEKIALPSWNSINWKSNNIIDNCAVFISQPNKIGNKYLIPTKITPNNLIRILGLSDSYQGVVGLNATKKKFFISPTGTWLHSYFKNKPYVAISITDHTGKTIYDVTCNGTDSTMKFQELNNISYQDNYKIKFWFAEATRGLYYDNGQWNKVNEKNINADITFNINNDNLEKLLIIFDANAIEQELM